MPYCAYKTDCVRVRPLRDDPPPPRHRPQFSCEFCDSNFDREENLHEHLEKCEKRLKSTKWVLKHRKSKLKILEKN